MSNMKLVDVFCFLLKKWKLILWVTLIATAATILFTSVLGTPFSSSCEFSLRNNDTIASLAQNSLTSTLNISTSESATAFPTQSGSSVAQYIDGIKLSKTTNARANPYKAGDIFSKEDLIGYLTDAGFRTYLSTNDVNVSRVNITGLSSGVSIRVNSKTKGICAKILDEVVSYIPSYIETLYANKINNLKGYHTTLIERDSQTINTLITRYQGLLTNQRATGATTDLVELEECRLLLNDYAMTAVNLEVSAAVVKQSDDLLNANLQPILTFTSYNIEDDSNGKSVLIFAIIGIAFGFVLGVFAAFITEILAAVRKKVKQDQADSTSKEALS